MSQIIRNITEITRCGVQYRTESLAPLELKACHVSYLLEICAEPGISCICVTFRPRNVPKVNAKNTTQILSIMYLPFFNP